ncbi:MAG: hypothetical protein OXC91_01840 [Rhodobacteraceae bacterium]|nr:hypothetical protein [Paracoccaceae bacterium]
MAVDPISEFTPKRWAAAKRILTGSDEKRVSVAAAAKAAEVPLHVFRAWVRRAEERRPDDPPAIHEIADVMQHRDAYIADALEDIGWDRAVNGTKENVYHQGEVVGEKVKHSDSLLFNMLKAHNRRRYGDKSEVQHNHRIEPSEIYQRMLAGHKMAETLAERGELIEGEARVMSDEKQITVLPAEPELPEQPVHVPVADGDVDLEISVEL